MVRAILGAVLVMVLAGAAPAQDRPAQPVPHTSPDPRKCRKCLPAYEKAMAYLQKNLGKATFPAKMVIAWLLLADGRHESDLKQIVNSARGALSERGSSQHAQNWYPALAGMFLCEYYKWNPTKEVFDALQAIVNDFVKTQERTGGWFKWFEGAYKDRLDYPVKDLGILDATIFGVLWAAKTHGVKVPDDTIQKADKCLEQLLSGEGISYGTQSRGGDTTGARGAFAMLGLDFAGQQKHRICTTYRNLLERRIPNLDKGHHWGGLHGLGVVLGCHVLGQAEYDKLVKEWLDKLIAKQDAEGGLYIGDDGDAGGEPGLIKSNYSSTASFALMILLQDQKLLRAPVKRKK